MTLDSCKSERGPFLGLLALLGTLSCSPGSGKPAEAWVSQRKEFETVAEELRASSNDWIGLDTVRRLREDQVADSILCYLPLCLAFTVLAGALRRREQPGWAALFYSFFPIPFMLAVTLLARFGNEEWLGLSGEWESEPVQLWLMANGLLYLFIGLAHTRSSAGFARFWGELFMLLVPVSLLVPANVMFEDPPYLFEIGGHGVGAYSCAAVLISLALVIFGTKLSVASLICVAA